MVDGGRWKMIGGLAVGVGMRGTRGLLRGTKREGEERKGMEDRGDGGKK